MVIIIIDWHEGPGAARQILKKIDFWKKTLQPMFHKKISQFGLTVWPAIANIYTNNYFYMWAKSFVKYAWIEDMEKKIYVYVMFLINVFIFVESLFKRDALKRRFWK